MKATQGKANPGAAQRAAEEEARWLNGREPAGPASCAASCSRRQPLRGHWVRLGAPGGAARRRSLPAAGRGAAGRGRGRRGAAGRDAQVRRHADAAARRHGRVRLLVAQCTHDFRAARRGARTTCVAAADADFATLVGNGRLAVTVEPDERGARYQGIVPLEGASLGAVPGALFRELRAAADAAGARGRRRARRPACCCRSCPRPAQRRGRRCAAAAHLGRPADGSAALPRRSAAAARRRRGRAAQRVRRARLPAVRRPRRCASTAAAAPGASPACCARSGRGDARSAREQGARHGDLRVLRRRVPLRRVDVEQLFLPDAGPATPSLN